MDDLEYHLDDPDTSPDAPAKDPDESDSSRAVRRPDSPEALPDDLVTSSDAPAKDPDESGSNRAAGRPDGPEDSPDDLVTCPDDPDERSDTPARARRPSQTLFREREKNILGMGRDLSSGLGTHR